MKLWLIIIVNTTIFIPNVCDLAQHDAFPPNQYRLVCRSTLFNSHHQYFTLHPQVYENLPNEMFCFSYAQSFMV